MSRRPTSTRRAALHGACAASLVLMAAPAAGPAKAAELDGDLISLLDEAKRLSQEWDATPPDPPTLSAYLAPRPWDALILQACAIPARTPEGMRAKAEAVRWWVLGDGMTACNRHHVPQEHLAVSLAADLLGEGRRA